MRLTSSAPGATTSSSYPAVGPAPRSQDAGGAEADGGSGENGSGTGGGFSAFGTPPSADAHRTAIVYEGRLGELYRIFLVNLLLSLVTFSIFRFWAKTRMRRYLWSHTSLSGDRFEYTGTGGELFIGFLIVMLIIVLAQLGMYALVIGSEPGSPLLTYAQSFTGIVILYITFVAQYAAQRYRLTRTLWRGISGGMTGSAWAWGFKGLFLSMLALLSLGLAWPWAQMRLIDDRLNNSFFGNAKASAQTSSKSLYRAYLLGIVVAAILGVVAISIISGLIDLLVTKLDWLSKIDIGDPTRAHISPELIVIIFLGALSFIFAFWAISVVAFSLYQAAMVREIATKLSVGGLRFATPITAGAIMSRIFGNIFIILVTFGFGFPIAIHRTMKFLAANIEVIGNVDGSEIARANLPRPRFGEGLLEAFDPGIM